MITLFETTSEAIIKQIVLDPVIYDLTGSTEDRNNFVLDNSFKHIIAAVDDKIAGLFDIKIISKITIEAHIAILPEFQKNGSALQIAEAGFEYAKEHFNAENITAVVPSRCLHVIHFLHKLGFSVFGLLKNGIIYKDHYNDLLYFSKKVS